MVEEPNHTTARQPGPLLIMHYSLIISFYDIDYLIIFLYNSDDYNPFTLSSRALDSIFCYSFIRNMSPLLLSDKKECPFPPPPTI